jgi:hypothetical protein
VDKPRAGGKLKTIEVTSQIVEKLETMPPLNERSSPRYANLTVKESWERFWLCNMSDDMVKLRKQNRLTESHQIFKGSLLDYGDFLLHQKISNGYITDEDLKSPNSEEDAEEEAIGLTGMTHPG